MLPAVLRHAGVLAVDPELAHRIDTRQPLPAHDRAHTELRAAAITACDIISKRYVPMATAIEQHENDIDVLFAAG